MGGRGRAVGRRKEGLTAYCKYIFLDVRLFGCTVL